MKKILVYGMSNTRGGVENYLLTMQQQLHGFSFEYLMEQCDCMYIERIEENGGKIHFFPPRNPIGNYVSQLSKILKEAHSYSRTLYMNLSDMTLDNMIVLLLGLRYKYKIIVHSHAAKAPNIHSKLHRILHSMIVGLSNVIYHTGIITCIAVSDRAANYMFPGCPYETVVPGIDIQKFAFDPDARQEVRSQLGLGDAYVYGFVGRLEAVKSPAFLLDVFHIICKKQDNCRLLMVGGGSLRESLEQQALKLGIADKVIFVGDTKDPAPYYQAMDHLLLPSQSEGLSMVAIEAQAAGLPFTGSAGRFPNTIILTPLVGFAALEDGAEAWAEACIAHGKQFAGADRTVWNHTLQESIFETKKAAENLLQALTASKTEHDQRRIPRWISSKK